MDGMVVVDMKPKYWLIIRICVFATVKRECANLWYYNIIILGKENTKQQPYVTILSMKSYNKLKNVILCWENVIVNEGHHKLSSNYIDIGHSRLNFLCKYFAYKL